MTHKISRRAFLKCAGVSAALMGTASLLSGCRSGASGSVEVKAGDKISNWNNLGVQLTSVFTLANAPDAEGYEYVAILVTAVNRSNDTTFAIGAQDLADINAAYPLTTEAEKAANLAPYFHTLAQSTTDFSVSCDGQVVEAGAYVSLYDSAAEAFTDSTCLPPQAAGYIELVCAVPKGWQKLEVTYLPTFVQDKTLTFTMSAADVLKA